MRKNQEVLRFEDVYSGYGKQEVIRGLSATVNKGEFVGLIGANGTGKSTLLKCISNLLPTSAGKIFINQIDNQSLTQKERAREIAVVPQSFSIDYDFNVEDIVMMGRNPYMGFKDKEGDRDRKIVTEAMELTNTLEFRERLFNALSGGEKQRVIIARAIAQESPIILLDEPTSALDIHHQIETMELIVKLNRERGKTVVAVLHDINLASRYCDRLIMLKDGIVSADGTPSEVITASNMQEIYQMRMLVRNNMIFNKPEVVALHGLETRKCKVPRRIHLICGSAGAVRLMDELVSMGHLISAGVLNEGSDDWLMARNLEIPIVETTPYTTITPEDRRKNEKLFENAEILFVADVPFGDSNIENLKGLEKCTGQIIIHRSVLMSDFTTSLEVRTIVDHLCREKNAIIVNDHDEFLNLLEDWGQLQEY